MPFSVDISHELSYSQRLQTISQQWGFNCSCSLCGGPKVNHEVSDERLKRMGELEKQMDDLTPARTATTASAYQLIKLYEQEGLHTPIAMAYKYAALENIYIGNKTMAKHYSTLSVHAARLWKGPRSQEVREMEAVMEQPENHKLWLISPAVQDRSR